MDIWVGHDYKGRRIDKKKRERDRESERVRERERECV